MELTLSSRLKKIAEEIGKDETVCDIGTDHAFLPVYLIREGMVKKAVITDVSRGSMEKAMINVSTLLPDTERIDARTGDGLEVLEAGECDTVVIAGMGGLLIRDILDWDIAKTRSFSKYVLQPRNNAFELRKWLWKNFFSISRDLIVKEGRHYCEIITASYEQGLREEHAHREMPDDVEFMYPDDIADDSGDRLIREYLAFELDKARAIKKAIEENSKNADKDATDISKRIERLEFLCKSRDCQK